MGLLDEVGFIVASASTGFTLGTNVMRSRLEPTPDEQIAIIETGGLPPENTMSSVVGAPVSERPRFQVVCRAAKDNYQTARTNAETAWKSLHNFTGPYAGSTGTVYHWMEALHPPFSIGPDENDRPLVAFNCQAHKVVS